MRIGLSNDQALVKQRFVTFFLKHYPTTTRSLNRRLSINSRTLPLMLQQPCKTGQSDEGLKPLLRAEGGGRIKMAECKTPQLETVSKECTRKWQRRQADTRSPWASEARTTTEDAINQPLTMHGTGISCDSSSWNQVGKPDLPLVCGDRRMLGEG